MNTLDTIMSRRSYRGTFRPDPVPRQDLVKILEAGLAAPSGCNKQTVSLIAVDDPAALRALQAVIDPPVGETAPAIICVLARRIIAYRDRCFAVQDYSAAIENMLLAIADLGYQSCWYEGHITDTDRIGDKMARILGVPEEYELVCFLPVGRAETAPVPPRKKPFAQRAWFNAYRPAPDYRAIFDQLHPGFFEEERIRSIPAEEVLTELALDLKTFPAAEQPPVQCPEGITFGVYQGRMEDLQRIVRTVEEEWVPYYNGENRAFCAFDGDQVVSFCLLEAMGEWQGLRIGGPGCVGTLPERRGQSTGLRMVQLATQLLQQEGYDLSWIHYTHIDHWYRKLGYVPVLRWNAKGIME